MIVTDIKDYAKGKFEIYLNDEFAFILYKSELNRFNISKGHELSDDTIALIKSELLVKRAIKRAMNLLLKNDMTQLRLYQKLQDNRYPEDVINEAVEYVKSFGYIDDRRYAAEFIRSRALSNSKNVIYMKLLDKGIDKHIIDEELKEFYENDELNADIEDELIKKQIYKKCKSVEELDFADKQKLKASLVRKGFSYSRIDKFLT